MSVQIWASGLPVQRYVYGKCGHLTKWYIEVGRNMGARLYFEATKRHTNAQNWPSVHSVSARTFSHVFVVAVQTLKLIMSVPLSTMPLVLSDVCGVTASCCDVGQTNG